MFIFFLQLRDTLHGGRLYVFSILVLITWALWLVKLTLSRRYTPWVADHAATASVIIPVVDEPVGLFHEVLDHITEQSPHEVIVVINGPRNEKLEQVCDAYPGVRRIWTKTPGKRNAIDVGLAECTGEIVVLVDSDTIWTTDTLRELVKPFADSTVGGVTTNQRIIDPDRNVLTRWADWLENIRVQYSMPAMSVLGQVGCLPGRTIAFRRSVLVDAMPAFLSERFLGVFLEVSDDRTLTNLCLKQNYRAVYQSTSRVFTDAPVGMRKMAKQQLRWSRGSQYNTLRMLPWMVRKTPVLAVFYVTDIVMPFLLLACATGFVVRILLGEHVNFYDGITHGYGAAAGTTIIVVLTLLATWFSVYIRQARHFEDHPKDLYLLPAFTLLNTFMLMPIRIWGFMRMARNDGWGTRANAFHGESTPSRRLNPWGAVPYGLAATMIIAGVAYHG